MNLYNDEEVAYRPTYIYARHCYFSEKNMLLINVVLFQVCLNTASSASLSYVSSTYHNRL